MDPGPTDPMVTKGESVMEEDWKGIGARSLRHTPRLGQRISPRPNIMLKLKLRQLKHSNMIKSKLYVYFVYVMIIII